MVVTNIFRSFTPLLIKVYRASIPIKTLSSLSFLVTLYYIHGFLSNKDKIFRSGKQSNFNNDPFKYSHLKPISGQNEASVPSKGIVIKNVYSESVTYTITLKTLNYFQKYTYDDPVSYKGRYVRAWPPYKSRDVTNYIKKPFTVVPRADKLNNKTLLVMVQSNPGNSAYRNNWRESWGKFANAKTAVVFLLGRERGKPTKATQLKLQEENNIYGDIVHVGGLIEHYDNLTLKSLYSLKFFLNKDAYTSTPPKYMLKVDTDTIVNLPLLFRQLDAYKNIKDLLVGCCYCCGEGARTFHNNVTHCERMKQSEKAYKKVTFYKRMGHSIMKGRRKVRLTGKDVKKWHVPGYMYNGNIYPSYLSGGSGYLISRSAAECIYKTAPKVPYFHLEDVYITGFVAQACGINRLDNVGFTPDKKNFENDKDIVTHHNCGAFSECYEQLKGFQQLALFGAANSYVKNEQ